jgi:mannose-6-phosphate isomerase-like protein (cupin superfamily)
MKITPQNAAINKIRPDGTSISYYIFEEYEVHYGELAPGVTQPWHHHEIINETLYVVEGKVLLHYLENGQKKQKEIVSGDVVQVEKTPHTFSNPFQKTCKMVAFRFVPEGVNKHHIIKNDKVLYPELD